MMKKTRKVCRGLSVALAIMMLLQGSNLDNAAAAKSVDEYSTASSTDADYDTDYDPVYHDELDLNVTSLSEIPSSCYIDELSAEGTGELASSYNTDTSNLKYITSVKNQTPYETCWAFAACAASEANIKMKYGDDVDLSEWQLAYFTNYNTGSAVDALGGTAGDTSSTSYVSGSTSTPNYLQSGGNQILAVRSMASWRGLTVENSDTAYSVISAKKYSSTTKSANMIGLNDKYAYESDAYHLQNAYIISMADTDAIKQNILNYGACGTSYYYYKDKSNYSSTYNSEYCATKVGKTNHAITIVGWDDSFSKENFNTTPEGDGAWLVKNSWGTSTGGVNGYFWLSYYDANLLTSDGYFYDVVEVGSEDDYDNNYQYDGGIAHTYYPSSASSYNEAVYEANVYVADSDEALEAVGFYTADTAYNYEISVYLGVAEGAYKTTKASYTVSGQELYAGYHTVELGKSIELSEGTRYSIVIKQQATATKKVTTVFYDGTETKSWYTSTSSAEAGQSFLGKTLTSMEDIGDSKGSYTSSNCRIKAFTNEVNSTGSSTDKNDNSSSSNSGNTDTSSKTETTTVPITGISLDTAEKTVIRGNSFNITAAVAPSNTTDSKVVSWTSSDTSIASVTGGGSDGQTATVTAVGSGAVTITATASNGQTAVCNVTVQVPAVTVSYRTHVQSYGWEGTYRVNGAMSGTSGQSKRLEAIQIQVSGNDKLGIQYVTHCQTYGWLSWSANGEENGTSGEAKRLEAIEIQLTGEDKDEYDVYYRVHAQSYGWLGWAKNGAPAGTAGLAKRLEGIQIIVVRKGESIDSNSGGLISSTVLPYISSGISQTTVSGADSVHVAYQTHVQSYGWQSWKYDGNLSGTSGEAKRLEGISIKLTNKDYSGGICYTTHVQSYGWQSWKSDGEMSGTSGEAKRLEAIKINLTGEMAEHYDVYYRVHAQSFGWMGWAKNGESAGTSGYSKRLEAIEIVLVPKGGNPPGSTANAFRQK